MVQTTLWVANGADLDDRCVAGSRLRRPVLSAEEWARQQYVSVELGDKRRNEQAVRMAAMMAAYPAVASGDRADGQSKQRGSRLPPAEQRGRDHGAVVGAALHADPGGGAGLRSEERRVGKEGR